MRCVRGILLALPAMLVLALAGCGGAPADFTLSASPATLSLTAGGAAQVSVTTLAVNGFGGPVSVAVSGLPTGVTASPALLSVTAGAPQSLTLTPAASAPAGAATLTLTGTSGTLTHTATVELTVAAAPPPPVDFTLAVSPTTQMLTSGASGSQVTLLVTAVHGFSGGVAVTVSGLPVGVTATPTTLTLMPGASQGLSLVASSSAVPGAATVTFTGVSGSLTHTATLAVTIAGAPTTPVAKAPDVTTYHYDNARDGLNAQETTLTPANVALATFGLKGVYGVDGKVDAQPLYVGNLLVQSGAQARTADVVYAATEHDSVYALEAGTGAQVWKSSVLGEGETPSDARGCGQIVPEIGITSTPVIDRASGPNGTIFVVGMSKDGSGRYHQRLHALDLTTGAELGGSPTEISASYPGTGANSQSGKVIFDPGQYAERVGLLLLNGTIYMGWTSHCDINPYTGWVMGYSESTLQQTTVLNLTPNGSEGSVWMSGYGLAADTAGNIYLLDANGTLDSGFDANGFPSQSDYGNALLKLSTGGGLKVSDYFEPYNTVAESAADQDLGSGGAMVLPDITDRAGVVHHLVVGAGKDRNIYVGNRDNLGKIKPGATNNSNLYQEIANALPNGAFSGPAYFNNTVFYAGVNDALKAYTISEGLLSTAPTSQSGTGFAYPGATPSVSANGMQNGIVWAVESATSAAGVLHAYDTTNLAHELYNSNQAAGGRDGFGTGDKFITPMVAGGRVFVGTTNGVAVFGLLGP